MAVRQGSVYTRRVTEPSGPPPCRRSRPIMSPAAFPIPSRSSALKRNAAPALDTLPSLGVRP